MLILVLKCPCATLKCFIFLSYCVTKGKARAENYYLLLLLIQEQRNQHSALRSVCLHAESCKDRSFKQ